MLLLCNTYAFTLLYLTLSFYPNYAVSPENCQFLLANREEKRLETPEFQAKNQLFSVMNHYGLVRFKNNPYLWTGIKKITIDKNLNIKSS